MAQHFPYREVPSNISLTRRSTVVPNVVITHAMSTSSAEMNNSSVTVVKSTIKQYSAGNVQSRILCYYCDTKH